jgi:hypothetical protein
MARLRECAKIKAKQGKRECIGIEPPQNPQEKPQSAGQAVQKSAHPLTDPDLVRIVAMWPHLSAPIRRAVPALIDAMPTELK